MSTTTTNYGIVLPEGSDTFSPLTFNNDAFTKVDAQMKKNQDAATTTATHALLDGINTIIRAIPSCNILTFVASADYAASQTFAVDGQNMTFRYADGSAPSDGAYKTNQAVMCIINGTILTLVSCNGEAALKDKVNDLEDTVDTNSEDIESIKNTLSTKIGDWQILKSEFEITGNTTVSIPSEAKEIMVYNENGYYSLTIPTILLSNTVKYFSNGYFASSTNNGYFVVNAYTTYIVLRLHTYNGTVQTSAKYTVLYR